MAQTTGEKLGSDRKAAANQRDYRRYLEERHKPLSVRTMTDEERQELARVLATKRRRLAVQSPFGGAR